MSWLLPWAARKKITITGSTGGAQTDYQSKITVTYAAKMQADFDDIRFTKSDGVTLLDHWLESKTDSTSAVVWVEIDSIPASPDTVDVWMYYGNPNAASASNGGTTFSFFDDFPGSSIDTGKWEGTTGSASVASSILTYGPGTNSMNTITDFSSSGIALRANRDMSNPGTNWVMFGLGVPSPAGTNNLCTLSPQNTQRMADADSYEDVATNWTIPGYKTIEIRRLAASISWFEADVERTGSPYTTAANIPSIALPIVFYPATPNYVYADWVLIRKYVSPEPSVGAAGSEELGGYGYAI